MSGPDYRAVATEAWLYGLCPLPAIAGKHPPVKWKQYQSRRPTLNEFNWNKYPGIGLLTGAVSGGLEMLELEGRALEAGLEERFHKAAVDAGIEELLTRIVAGYYEATPRGGRHMLYYCDRGGISAVLAETPARKPLIETRGEGGYTIIAPSQGRTHPNGGAWQLLTGSLTTIATISPNERHRLHTLCRTFDQRPKPTAKAATVAALPRPPTNDERPGDRYNRTTRWAQVLEPHGWALVGEDNGEGSWRRPGKTDDGSSATTNHQGTDTLKVFSTSTPFDTDGTYTKFGALAILEHDGDHHAAARAIADATDAPKVGERQGERDTSGPRGPDVGRARDRAAKPDEEPDTLDPSWQLRDLGPAVRGELVSITPAVLRVDGGQALFYPGRINGLHGIDGIGKTFAVLVAAAQEIKAGHHVVWLDFEEPNEKVVVDRLLDLGVTSEALLELFHYRGPLSPFDQLAIAEVAQHATRVAATLLTVDSLGEAFSLESVDENLDVEVAPWVRRVLRPLADAGPAVVVVDHSTKSKENPLHPSGSKRKRAAITGSSYLVEDPIPLTREHGGRLTLTCAKDRHGNYKRGAIVCEIEITAYGDGGQTAHVWPPMQQAAGGTAAFVAITRSAVAAARDAGQALSRSRLVELMEIKASRATKFAAVEHAVGNGALRTEDGPRNALMHHYVRDFIDRENDQYGTGTDQF